MTARGVSTHDHAFAAANRGVIFLPVRILHVHTDAPEIERLREEFPCFVDIFIKEI